MQWMSSLCEKSTTKIIAFFAIIIWHKFPLSIWKEHARYYNFSLLESFFLSTSSHSPVANLSVFSHAISCASHWHNTNRQDLICTSSSSLSFPKAMAFCHFCRKFLNIVDYKTCIQYIFLYLILLYMKCLISIFLIVK